MNTTLPIARSNTRPRYSSLAMGSVSSTKSVLHQTALGPSLVRDQGHAQNLARRLLGFSGVAASLTPPPLPRPPA
jgi:hypothetical protein